MTNNQINLTKHSPLHYAWIICIITCMIYFLTIGGLSNSSYGPYLISDAGLTNTESSWLVSIRVYVAILFTALSQPFYKRFSLRIGFTGGLLLGGIAWFIYMISARGDSFASYIPGAVLMGVGYGLSGGVACALIVNNWFVSRKNLVFGITTASSGFTAIVLPPVIGILAEAYSLSAFFMVTGITYVVIGLVVWFLVKDRPEQMGLLPYGIDDPKEAAALKTSKKRKSGRVYSITKFHITLYLIVHFFIGIQLFATWSHVSVLLSTAGYDTVTFSGLLSFCGICLIFGKTLYGWVTDRGNAETSFYIFCPIQATGCIINAIGALYLNFPLTVIGCLLECCAGVISTVGVSALAAELFPDERNFTKAVTWCLVVYNLGNAIFAPFFGMVADATGSYAPAFIGAGILGYVNIVLIAILFRSAKKRAKKLGLTTNMPSQASIKA